MDINTFGELFSKKNLEVTFLNKSSNKTLTLFYCLFDIELVKNFCDNINNSNANNSNIIYNHIFSENKNKKFLELKENVDAINNLLLKFNVKNRLKKFDTIEETNQELLNFLHYEFELFCNYKKDIENSELTERFNLLNIQIHSLETLFAFDIPNSCIIKYENSKHYYIKPEDCFLFSPLKWGYVYSGYNTVGKNLMTIFLSNDLNSISREQNKPQITVSSEFFLSFIESNAVHDNVNFYKWWIKNNVSNTISPNITIQDYAYGYIPYGMIVGYLLDEISSDLIFLKSHIENNWHLYTKILDIKINDFSNKNIYKNILKIY